MVEIKIQVCGDHWINQQQVQQSLRDSNGVIILDLGTEGASLSALGIESVMLAHCDQQGLDPAQIIIRNWPNTFESTPFTREYLPRISHFVWLSQRYWSEPNHTTSANHRVALFVGRPTPARAAMLYHCYHYHANDVLLSLMHNHNPTNWQYTGIENIGDWFADAERTAFLAWWATGAVTSLDDHWISDQYDLDQNTNRDILGFYHLFDLELVAETYTYGSTFFPTEKTFRPMMSMKPMLLHGPPLFLHNLRQLGFKTFHDHWDEGYDQYQGPERWRRLRGVLEWMLSLSNTQWTQLMHTIKPILEHNRQHLQHLSNQYCPS